MENWGEEEAAVVLRVARKGVALLEMAIEAVAMVAVVMVASGAARAVAAEAEWAPFQVAKAAAQAVA